MGLIRLLVEMIAVNRQISVVCIPLFFRHYLCVEGSELRERSNRVIHAQLFVYLTAVRFVYPEVWKGFVVDIRFPLQASRKIAYMAQLGNEDFKGLLQIYN